MEDKKAIDRPDLSRIWASSGAAGVTSIDAEKYLLGWVAEIPTYQHMNFLHNRMDKIQLALAERGFHAWGTDIKYTLGSLVWNDKDSYVYVSKVENPIQEPSVTSTHWVRSMCQLTVQEFLNIEKLIQTHEADKTNPHGVSAGQIGAYTKPETDTKISQLNTSLTSHANNKSNPHGVTAEQAGAIHTSRGGTYSGKVTFNHSETGFGSHNITNDGNGFNLKVGNKRLGLNTSGLPIYFDGTNNNNILFDTNFDEWRANTESEYSVPAPDVHIPFISDLNMIEGFGCVEYSRPTPATYTDKSGVLRTAAIDEPRFEKEGLLIEGQSTNLIIYSNEFAKFDCTLTKEVVSGIELTRVTRSGVSDSYITSGHNILAYSLSTVSFYLKKSEIPVGFSFYIDAANGYVELDSAAVVVKDVGNDLVRVSRVATLSGNTLPHFRFEGGIGTTFVIGGIQIEALPFATSYIPTKGAAATRAGDRCLIQALNNLPNEGTIAVNFDTLGISGLRQCIFSYGVETPQGFASLYVEGDHFTSLWTDLVDVRTFGSPRNGIVVLRKQGTTLSLFNSAGRWDNLNMKTLTTPTTTNINIGNRFDVYGNGVELFGHIRNFRIWHKALTDKQISTLS